MTTQTSRRLVAAQCSQCSQVPKRCPIATARGDLRRAEERLRSTVACLRMLLPAEPRAAWLFGASVPAQEFLSWEYGRCLGTHVWPWRTGQPSS